MDAITNGVVRFLTGDFALSGELQCFWMAVQGAMAVRKGPNRNGNLHWFHAFALSVLAGYAGASFGFLWMGRPSSMLSSDLNMASCILAYIFVNYTPMDIGYKICDSLPVTIVTVSFSQLFRSLGIMKFATACFEAFKDNPSPYYPIPVFGPIIYATLLGNMGGFFLKGFDGHLANGMPWPVQNGLFCASFYHFYVHDTTGPIGMLLRKTLLYADWLGFGDDPKTFATAFIGLFMQVVGILQIPAFLGPSFTPFGMPIASPWKDSTTWTAVGKRQPFGPVTPPPRRPPAKAKKTAPKKNVAAPAKKVATNTSRSLPATTSTTRTAKTSANPVTVANGQVGDAEPTETKSKRKRNKKKKKPANKQKGE